MTPALREWYSSGDLEELEYVAMAHAARASLRLLADDPEAPRRRVVLAAEMPGRPGQASAGPTTRPGRGQRRRPGQPGGVRRTWTTWSRWTTSRAAAAALPKADEGDDDAQFTVDGAEGHELIWYARQELQYLIA